MATRIDSIELVLQDGHQTTTTTGDESHENTDQRGLAPMANTTADMHMTFETPSDAIEYPTGFSFYMVLFSLVLSLILGGFDNNVVATAVPSITDEFHTVSDVGWYSVAYRLSLCVSQFAFGKAYKLFSVKRIFLVSIAIMQAGSLVCATATTSPAFIIGRAIAGLGQAGAISGTFTLLAYTVPLRRRPIYSAVLGGIESASELSAPVIGGVLTQNLSWRWCFYITLPFGAISFAVIAFFLSDLGRTADMDLSLITKLAQLDPIGNFIFLPATTCLFVALSWAGTRYSWSSPTVIGLFLASVILIGLFFLHQYHMGDSATLPLRILRRRSVMCGLVFSTCCAGSIQVLTYYMPTYFQAVRQYSPSKAGYNMFPLIIGFSLGMVFQGAGTTIVGFYTPFMLLCSVLSAVSTGLLTTWTVSSTSVTLICYSAFAGLASGVGYQAPQIAVQTTLPAQDAALGLSVILFAQHFGPALFISVAQSVLSNRLSSNLQVSPGGLNATSIQDIGLSDLSQHFNGTELDTALLALDKSLVQTWYLPVALACMTMGGALGMEWRSIKKKQS